jgi:hypothetical protein
MVPASFYPAVLMCILRFNPKALVAKDGLELLKVKGEKSESWHHRSNEPGMHSNSNAL